MFIQNLSDDQKEQVTDWIEENAKFEEGDLVTVDYESDDIWFAHAEYGGIPLRVQEVTWMTKDLKRISKSGLHSIQQHNDEDRLIQLFNPEEIPPDSHHTEYVTVKPSYKLEVAVWNDIEINNLIEEPALIEWDDYEGDLQFHLRDTDSTTLLQEGEECRVCGFKAEKVSESYSPAGAAGSVSCAVCGFIKERWAP